MTPAHEMELDQRTVPDDPKKLAKEALRGYERSLWAFFCALNGVGIWRWLP